MPRTPSGARSGSAAGNKPPTRRAPAPSAGRGGRPTTARAIAVDILVRVNEEDAWASRLLDAQGEDVLDARDHALLHEIVLGVLRWRGALDAALAPLLRKTLPDLEPAVREALRIGAYQLLFLDRVPDHAAVDESVTIARRRSGPGAAGLVNAVLRRLSAGRKEARAATKAHPDEDDAAARGTAARGASAAPVRGLARRLAAELSHPEWMVARALDRLGEEETRAWMLANNRPPPLSLRPSPTHEAFADLRARLAAEGVATEPGLLAPGSLRVLEGRPERTALFASGAFWIQDEGSQVVPLLFPAPWEGWTADLCAAPGGKSFVLATGPLGDGDGGGGALVGSERSSRPPGGVVAFDLHPHRLARLAAGARRIAPDRIGVVGADLTAGAPVAASSFERVLVDAPCSGTGVLRRHPEIRWRLSRKRLGELATLQSRLLDTAYALLAPGGDLVYSVCSLEPEEGDAVLDAFLARSGARAVDPRGHLPRAVAEAVDARGRLRTFPHRQGSDGFFAALVTRPPAPRG